MASPDASSVPTRLAPFIELDALVDAEASAAETRIAPLAVDASAAETRMTPRLRGTGAQGSMSDGARAGAERAARGRGRRRSILSGRGLALVVAALAMIAAGVLYALVQDGGIVWPW